MMQCPSRPEGKKRDWWSIDLEGEIEKLEVEGGFSETKGESVDPKGEIGHCQFGRSLQKKKVRNRKELNMRNKKRKWKWMRQHLTKRVLKSKVRKEM